MNWVLIRLATRSKISPDYTVYDHLGFKQVRHSKYTPHYVKRDRRFRNQIMRLKPEERNLGLTEWQLRRKQGYGRIWDCGHRSYLYEIKGEI